MKSMAYWLFVPLLTIGITAAYAIDPNAQRGYDSGIETGQQAFDPGLATNQSAAESLPNYNTNPPETAYANDPNAATNQGESMVSTSDAGQAATSAKNTMSQESSLTNGTDPIYQRDGAESTLSSSYAGCTTVTGTMPGATTAETCSATPPAETHRCNRTLSVSVEQVPSCTLGTEQAVINQYYAWRRYFCASTTRVTCGPELNGQHQVVSSASNSWGSGSISFMLDAATSGVYWSGFIGGTIYTYESRGCDINGVCTLAVSCGNTAVGTFQLSRIITNYADTWANGCETIEARVVP